ncbi:homocysteine S-methyltransferase family protein [Agathobaculum sp. Marseille-P7918]|uniref:homocysteine S-methyltransferase family protein n=1 Tax=Agathobaculum sp. Marseille-P7918 TaxID=2479843 RepID=UPI000F62C3DF|nr:homocysteine S-methyltransferase family protein [Agathobaculum sp. Marseille-P7918]
MNLLEKLGREWLFFDGGTGTILQERGLAAGELPETWNLTHPEEIVSLHCGYLEAGSDIINTNTFGANALKYPDNLREIVEAAVMHAKKARALSGRSDAYIALDIGPTGRLLQPMGDLPFERAVELFGEVVRIGAAAGADLVLIETMSDSYEAKAAVLAAKENCDLPVFATMIFDENGKMLTGGTVDSVVAMLEGLRVDALGVNCGLGPEQMKPIVQRLTQVSSLPIIVNPNAGLPRSENGKTVFDIDADAFAQLMAEIADMGVQVLGGCCGTTPDHIRRMIEACKAKPVAPVTPKHRTVVSSFSQAVEIGKKPVIIGERINPTGKSKFKAALRENNIEYILSEGLTQEDSGAHILDVNVGLPEIDEPKMMETVVSRLQSVLALPLQIDTSNTEAMERGMRLYNGKPMINSVSGKMESMRAVFPLVQKYGGVVVGLTLDENGIPNTAEGRVQIARKIYDTAAAYGISRDDIVIDGLAMTISSDSGSALVTLETLRRVRDELGGHTILGVSNISFGLPQREIINANFFTMALQNGLSCAIINPNTEAMMRSYRAFLALTNQDAQCSEYIAAYGNQPAAIPQNTSAGAAMTLGESIERGLSERAAQATREALGHTAPLEIVNTELIPALDRVGKGFERGTIFLPQLLMSAEAAKAAFEVVKDAMRGAPQQSRGKIILATVKGDIHDIGKNIVKVLLENYGYQVIDLGKDVDPSLIVHTAKRENIQLVGLSALMTTTVVSMEQTIRLLRAEKPDTKIVVGGAVLTQEYADSIGADCYARDAMATVHFADQVFGN